jgi:hypothetical protein
MLFEQIDQKGSVIILQETLFNMLPAEEQKKLIPFDLEQSKYKIRDDFQAKNLFYTVYEDSPVS